MEQFARFREVVRLMVELGRRQAMELQADRDDPQTRLLVFEEDVDPGTQFLMDKLKTTLDLDSETSRPC